MRVMKWTSVRCSNGCRYCDPIARKTVSPAAMVLAAVSRSPTSIQMSFSCRIQGWRLRMSSATSDNAAARTAFFEICRAKGWVASMIFVILLAISHVASLSAPPNPPLRTAPATGRGSVVRPARDVMTDLPSATNSSASSAASFVPPNIRIRSDTRQHLSLTIDHHYFNIDRCIAQHGAGDRFCRFRNVSRQVNVQFFNKLKDFVQPCWHSDYRLLEVLIQLLGRQAGIQLAQPTTGNRPDFGRNGGRAPPGQAWSSLAKATGNGEIWQAGDADAGISASPPAKVAHIQQGGFRQVVDAPGRQLSDVEPVAAMTRVENRRRGQHQCRGGLSGSMQSRKRDAQYRLCLRMERPPTMPSLGIPGFAVQAFRRHRGR